jgi:hypothetical protein
VHRGQFTLCAVACAISSAVLLTGGRARAAGEAEWQLSTRIGAGNVSLGSIDPRSPWGLSGALDLEYGFSDAWAGRVSVGGGVSPVSASMRLPAGQVSTTTALAGVTYTFDVLRLVPYTELAVGLVRFGGALAQPHTTFAAELGVGADYLVTRRWSTGISFQYLFSPSDLLSNAMDLGSAPFTFSVTARVSRFF